MREKGKSSIREVLKERDETLWEKLEEVWLRAEPLFEAIENVGDKKDKTAGKAHSLAVEDNLSALISDDRKHTLQPIELSSLSSAACLHDMDKSLKVLKKYHGEIASGEVGLNFDDYGLDPGQADIVRWIIRVHDHGSFDMDLPAEPLVIGTAEVDIKPLAAIFKLADILHADYRRSNDPHPTEAKERARICIRGWRYDNEGRIEFHAVPEKVSDLDHIHRAIAMIRKAIEPMAPVLREAGYPYELTRADIDESKLIYPAQERRRSGRSFIGMDSFGEDDQHLFKGREKESEELYELLQAGDPIVALVGDSGVGKTSLIRAALFPILRKTGNWKIAYTRPLNDPASDVIRAIWLQMMESDPPDDTDLVKTFGHISTENWDSILLVVIDQFEDVFRSPDAPERIAESLRSVQARRFSNLRVLLSYRADAEGQVGPMLQDVAASLQTMRRIYLKPLDRDGAKEALDAGLAAAQIGLDPDIGSEVFVKEILDDIEAQGRGFYPPYIQMMGETLKDNAEKSIVMKSKYDSLGSAEGIIGNYLFNQLKSFGDRRGDVERILVELTSISGPEGRKARTRSVEDLERDLRMSRADLTNLLHRMSRRWMVRHLGGGQYEVIHDQLAKLVDEKLIAAGTEREFRQLREHLAAAAATYANTGVPLDSAIMIRLYQYREQISTSPTEKVLLLHSCFAGRGPAWYWLKEGLPAESFSGLRKMLKEEDRSVRSMAAKALAKLVTHENIPELMEMLRDEDSGVQWIAAKALVDLNAQEAIPELMQMLRDEDSGVRRVAAESLAELNAQETIPELVQMLKDEGWGVLRVAAKALAKLNSQEAIPELVRMQQDEDIRVQRVARKSLMELVTNESIPELMEMLRYRDFGVQSVAAESLAKQVTHENIPELMEMLGDEDSDVRRAAAKALAELDAQEAIPELMEILRNKQIYVPSEVTEALISLNPEENIPFILDMIISGSKDASEARDVLMGMDRKLYCPFEQSENEE